MSSATPPLHHLTLTPLSLTTLPNHSQEFRDDLLAEAKALFEHPEWVTAPTKAWYSETVKTRTLPMHAFKYEPKHHPSNVTEPGTSIPIKRKTAGNRFFFHRGGGHADEEPEHNLSPEDDHRGLAWHERITHIPHPSGVGGHAGSEVDHEKDAWSFEVLEDALAKDHCQKEQQYVKSLYKVMPIGSPEQDCFMKLYELPRMMSNRSFLAHVIHVPVSTTFPRSFFVFSLPVAPAPGTPAMAGEKHHVRGRYVAVEEVKELADGAGIEWRCASMSTPGGNLIPRMSEPHMQSSLADNVPSFLTWLKSQYGSRTDPSILASPTSHNKTS